MKHEYQTHADTLKSLSRSLDNDDIKILVLCLVDDVSITECVHTGQRGGGGDSRGSTTAKQYDNIECSFSPLLYIRKRSIEAYNTHTWPSSWAIVKAADRPLSWTMAQDCFLHIVPNSAKPNVSHLLRFARWQICSLWKSRRRREC